MIFPITILSTSAFQKAYVGKKLIMHEKLPYIPPGK